MKILIAVFIAIIFLPVISFSQIKSINKDALADLMTGSFSSSEQSVKDPSYKDLNIRMKRIWTERSDGPWLYYEISETHNPEQPVNQKVFNIKNTYEGRFKISEYLISDASRFAGKFNDENPLPGLFPDSLKEENSCFTIVTLMDKDVYKGGNNKMICTNNKDVKYISTDVIISSEGIKKWDKGFDENEIQIWGPREEGYFFKRN